MVRTGATMGLAKAIGAVLALGRGARRLAGDIFRTAHGVTSAIYVGAIRARRLSRRNVRAHRNHLRHWQSCDDRR